jgi:SUMO ligase MMS21 Smc5/6 complex component
MKEVASYKPVYETMIRRDNPETQLDKLVIVDNLLGLTSPGAIDQITLSLINSKVARFDQVPESLKYDKTIVQAIPQY